MKATYYTTDGSTPTTASPVYTGPFTINQATTFKFFSVDNSGNTEAVQTQQVQVQPNADPVVGAAGDIACDPTAPAFNGGQGTAGDGIPGDCAASRTVGLMTGVDAVLPLGDNQYDCGGTSAFQQSYDPTWGQKLDITHPVPGGSDYATSGGTDCPTTAGAGYYSYFGSRAGDPTKGYYSYNLGQWHVIALNTAPCENGDATFFAPRAAPRTSGCSRTWPPTPRPAPRPTTRTHAGTRPRPAPVGTPPTSSSGRTCTTAAQTSSSTVTPTRYERFAPLNASGAVDNTYGLREFIVGTAALPGHTRAGSPDEPVLNNTTHGVIAHPHAGSYGWSSSTTARAASPTRDRLVPQRAARPGQHGSGHDRLGHWHSHLGWVVQRASYRRPVRHGQHRGLGVDKTYYTTNGSTPTTASTVYTGPFTVSSTSTVKFFSVDKGGNAEAVKSQAIQIDTAAPATTISCNGAACTTGWYKTTPVTVTLPATDTGGSGVKATVYTTDGSNPQTSSTALVYSGPFTVPQTTTVKYYSVDLAGNLKPSRPSRSGSMRARRRSRSHHRPPAQALPAARG